MKYKALGRCFIEIVSLNPQIRLNYFCFTKKENEIQGISNSPKLEKKKAVELRLKSCCSAF